MFFSNFMITFSVFEKAHLFYVKDSLESILDYRKNVFLWLFNMKDIDFFNEWGILKNDIKRLYEDFIKSLKEQNEEYPIYKEDQDDSFLKHHFKN